jgi:integrase
MTRRRSHGEGSIDPRGPDTWRLRYRVDGKRDTVTFHGPLLEACKELRRLLRDGDTDQHVAPDKVTFEQWAEQWIKAGAPGRRKKKVGRRTLERYEELLKHHVVPTLGTRTLQKITGADIASLYAGLEGKISPYTALHVHVVLGSCLNAAVRTGKLTVTPMSGAMNIPSRGGDQVGTGLDGDELATLLRGFRGYVLFPIVAVAAFTGARRNEVLALRWSDLDVAAGTLRIERAIEETKEHGRKLKAPKTARGKRTIQIDCDLLDILVAERERYLRTGVADGAQVDLSLMKLPDDALMFAAPPPAGENFSFTRLRCPRAVTKEFQDRTEKLGFGRLRLHDLRGTHETLLLDAGVPVHVVAERCGHDPAKRTPRSTIGRPRSLASCRRARCEVKLAIGSSLGPKPAAFPGCSSKVAS